MMRWDGSRAPGAGAPRSGHGTVSVAAKYRLRGGAAESGRVESRRAVSGRAAPSTGRAGRTVSAAGRRERGGVSIRTGIAEAVSGSGNDSTGEGIAATGVAGRGSEQAASTRAASAAPASRVSSLRSDTECPDEERTSLPLGCGGQDTDFDAPVGVPGGDAGPRGYGLPRAVPLGGDALQGDALRDQVAAHRLRAELREVER